MLAPRVADLVHDPRHAGPLGGAACVGEARGGEGRRVLIGLWLDASGRIVRARHRTTSCASLIAYAEAACALLESGTPPADLGAARLVAAVRGVHSLHRGRAALVAAALAASVSRPSLATGASP